MLLPRYAQAGNTSSGDGDSGGGSAGPNNAWTAVIVRQTSQMKMMGEHADIRIGCHCDCHIRHNSCPSLSRSANSSKTLR